MPGTGRPQTIPLRSHAERWAASFFPPVENNSPQVRRSGSTTSEPLAAMPRGDSLPDSFISDSFPPPPKITTIGSLPPAALGLSNTAGTTIPPSLG